MMKDRPDSGVLRVRSLGLNVIVPYTDTVPIFYDDDAEPTDIVEALGGAINVPFFDGHGEQVKLDGLGQLYWHRDCQPPPKRPGLP